MPLKRLKLVPRGSKNGTAKSSASIKIGMMTPMKTVEPLSLQPLTEPSAPQCVGTVSGIAGSAQKT